MKVVYIVIISLIVSKIAAQSYDHNWPMGILENNGSAPFGNAVLHFDTLGHPVIEKRDLKMNFERTVAAISDTTGQLIFYTNGCYIANASGDTMQNGEGINPGLVHDWVCPQNGYIVQQGAMALPMPGSDQLYCLLHLAAQYDPNVGYTYGPFYYSTIDMSLDNGNGAVVDKNMLLTTEVPESFAVIRHGNGRDWWVIVPEYLSNKYRIFLLSKQGFTLWATVSEGPSGF